MSKIRVSVDNVALKGGPLHGYWYTVADWEICRQAALNMGRTADMPQGNVLGYTKTRGHVANPNHRLAEKGVTATVWKWTV